MKTSALLAMFFVAIVLSGAIISMFYLIYRANRGDVVMWHGQPLLWVQRTFDRNYVEPDFLEFVSGDATEHWTMHPEQGRVKTGVQNFVIPSGVGRYTLSAECIAVSPYVENPDSSVHDKNYRWATAHVPGGSYQPGESVPISCSLGAGAAPETFAVVRVAVHPQSP